MLSEGVVAYRQTLLSPGPRRQTIDLLRATAGVSEPDGQTPKLRAGSNTFSRGLSSNTTKVPPKLSRTFQHLHETSSSLQTRQSRFEEKIDSAVDSPRYASHRNPQKPLNALDEASSRTTFDGKMEDRIDSRIHGAGNGASKEVASRKGCAEDGEDWKALTDALVARKALCAVSNHELVKMSELRFSRNMSEGDSGDQVLLLQRVLFWLGYLSQQSYITGYFGEETKEALTEFQKAHGVHSTGIWGSLSKQALWHDISAEILHRVGGEETVYQDRQVGIPKGPFFHGHNMPKTWKTMQLSFTESVSKAVSTMHLRDLALDKFGMVVLVSAILFGLLKLQLSMYGSFSRQSIKRRILHSQWYGDLVPQSRALRAFWRGRVELNNHNMIDGTIQNQSSASQVAKRFDMNQHEVNAKRVNEREAFSGSSQPSSRVNANISNLMEPHGHLKPTSASPEPPDKGVELEINTVSPVRRQSLHSKSPPDPSTRSGETPSKAKHMSARFQPQKSNPTFTNRNAGSTPYRRTIMMETPSKKLADPEMKPFTGRVWEPQSYASIRMPVVSSSSQRKWQDEDELNLRRHIKELHEAVLAAEKNRQTAMRALAEERQRSLELEVQINKQREAAAALEGEVRELKESHDALLASLRRKFSSSAAARTAAALVYQSWDTLDGKNSRNFLKDEKSNGWIS